MARVGIGNYEKWLTKEGCSEMNFTGRAMKGYIFVDENGINYGGDISLSDKIDRPGEFDNAVGQGAAQRVHTYFGRVTYQLFKTDSYLEVEGRFRKENDLNSFQVLGGLRVSLPQRELKY